MLAWTVIMKVLFNQKSTDTEISVSEEARDEK